MDNRIEKAREDWFANHPFEPNKHSVLAHDEDGLPAGFFTLPDMGDMSIVSLKYGYEFLAAVRTDDDVDEWLASINQTAKSPDLAGIMLAHAFCGIAPIIGQIIDNGPGLAETMKTISVQGWGQEF